MKIPISFLLVFTLRCAAEAWNMPQVISLDLKEKKLHVGGIKKESVRSLEVFTLANREIKSLFKYSLPKGARLSIVRREDRREKVEFLILNPDKNLPNRFENLSKSDIHINISYNKDNWFGAGSHFEFFSFDSKKRLWVVSNDKIKAQWASLKTGRASPDVD